MVNVKGIWLIPAEGSSGIAGITNTATDDGRWYNLQGQSVANPTKGLYIRNGKKIVIR